MDTAEMFQTKCKQHTSENKLAKRAEENSWLYITSKQTITINRFVSSARAHTQAFVILFQFSN